jgi:hypothetical protein
MLLFFIPVVTQAKVPLSSNFLVSFFNPWAQEKFPGWEQGIPYKPVGIDDLRIFYPQRIFTQAVIATGELPFWNPYSFSGNYHIGLSETAVFYPFFFIFSLLPQSFSWLLLQLMLPIIGFVGMYSFLRYHLAKPYAFFGGIVFGFSGIVLVRMVEGLSVGHTLIWLPYALWGIEGFIKEKKLRFLVILTGAMSLSVLAGWFQFAFYLVTYSALYAIWKVISNVNHRQYLNLLVFVPFVLVPLLTLFHILPAINTLIDSPRSDINLINLQKHLLPLSHIFTLFYPDYWGNPATLSFFGRSEYKESIVFIGVIPTLLAFFSLIHLIKYRVVIFFILSAIVAFLLGTENLISREFMHAGIPLVSSFLPDRTMYLVSVSLCILSAFGLRAFIEEKKRRNIFIACILLVVLVLVILSHRLITPYLPVGKSIQGFLIYWFEPINAYFDGRPGVFVDPIRASVQAKNVILGNLFIFLFFVSFLIRGILKRKGVLLLFFIATVIGQLYFGYKYIPFSYTQFIFPAHPVFSYLQKEAGFNRFITTGSGYIPSNVSLPYKIYSPDGVGSMYPRRYGELVTYAMHNGSRHETPRIESRIETDARELLTGKNAYLERFMQIDGVKYVVVLTKDVPAQIDKSYSKIWNDKNWQIFTYNDATARVFWTGKYEVVKDREQLGRLFDPLLPEQAVLLEKDPGIPASQAGTGIAEVISYTPNKTIIRSNSSGDGLVYISDNYTHNVKAFVDNKEVELLRANYSFRAIPVAKGIHKIVLTYYDQGFIIGLLVAGSTLLLSFGVVALLRRKKIYF